MYWVPAEFTSGMAATLQAAIVAEHVPAHRLGSVRSVLATLSILASAAGPVAYAALGTAGLTMAAVLWGSVATMLVATLMGIAAAHKWPLKPQMTHSK